MFDVHLFQTIARRFYKKRVSDVPTATEREFTSISAPAYNAAIEGSDVVITETTVPTLDLVATPTPDQATTDLCERCRDPQFSYDLGVHRWRDETCQFCLIVNTLQNLAKELDISPWKTYLVEAPYLVYDWTQLDIARSSNSPFAGFDLKSSAGREITGFDDNEEQFLERRRKQAINKIYKEREKGKNRNLRAVKDAQHILDKFRNDNTFQRSLCVNLRLPSNWFRNNCKYSHYTLYSGLTSVSDFKPDCADPRYSPCLPERRLF